LKDAVQKLLAGDLPHILVGRDELPDRFILLPGSFNPLHRGHQELLAAAEKTAGREGIFELSVLNVDKPPLDNAEVDRRLQQMRFHYTVVLTCAPAFSQKAELFPGAWFALGFDTAVRLLNPRYHDDIPSMLERFAELGTRFVVAGRLYDGVFQGLEELHIPGGFEELFIQIPEHDFREDISSTELRGEMEL
jgi:hypothetical protein